MRTEKLKIFIADDKREICDSLEENLITEIEKYNLTKDDIHVVKAFTEHAYEHGTLAIAGGFVPDICIFDLVFNGYSGIDLYKYITTALPSKKIDLCIYTGVERKFEKRKEAEVMASSTGGLIKIVAKPNVAEILEWFDDLIEKHFNIEKIIEEKDPFDLL